MIAFAILAVVKVSLKANLANVSVFLWTVTIHIDILVVGTLFVWEGGSAIRAGMCFIPSACPRILMFFKGLGFVEHLWTNMATRVL